MKLFNQLVLLLKMLQAGLGDMGSPCCTRTKDLGKMVETVLGERSTEEDLLKLQRCIEALQCTR